MLHQVNLDWERPEASIHLDFVPQVMTVINPTPFPVLLRGGSGAAPSGLSTANYVCPAGNVLSLPTKMRDWGARLLTSGSEPEGMTPALLFFTQEEPTPSLSMVGVAEVAYRKTFNYADITTNATAYTITNTSWVALNDDSFNFELECPTGKALIGFTARVTKVDGTYLLLGVYDTLSGGVNAFAMTDYATFNSFVGVVDFGVGGLRTLYLRARLRTAGSSGFTIHRPGYVSSSWEFWGMGF